MVWHWFIYILVIQSIVIFYIVYMQKAKISTEMLAFLIMLACNILFLRDDYPAPRFSFFILFIDMYELFAISSICCI